MPIASPADISKYRDHLSVIQSEWNSALARENLDGAVVPAGIPRFHFADDLSPPFRANPHFLRWVPHIECEHAVVIVRPSQLPSLIWMKPEDFWHLPLDPPAFVHSHFDVEVVQHPSKVWKRVARHIRGNSQFALVGPEDGIPDMTIAGERNPDTLLARLDYRRAYKTGFELDCTVEATRTALLGHVAAKEAFVNGGSEFDIHMAYLRASQQTEADLPYPNIVGLNEHASALHYQRYDRQPPTPAHSLLIDAGGRHMGYQSDITRTYSADPSHPFQELIEKLDQTQQSLIRNMKPGCSYTQAHEDMRFRIAQVLYESDILHCAPETATETDIVDVFFPHGLGHLLGLITHEAGGHLVSEDGVETNPSEKYPYLRLTREIEPGQIFTVEPGIYFIPMLLERLRGSKDLNWQKIETLIPCGGARIEDNVHVESKTVTNLTRREFARLRSSR